MHDINVSFALAESPYVLLAHWQALLAAYLLFRIVYNIFFHHLARFPGPWLAKVSDVWKAYVVTQCRFQSEVYALHKQYGDVVRIGPNEVSVIAPDQVREIYGSKDFYKGPFYTAFAAGGASHFSDRDPTTHALRRRSVAPSFSSHYIRSLEPFCDACAQKLFGYFDRAAEDGRPVDISELIGWFAYDSVSSIGFGESYGLLDKKEGTRGIPDTLDTATRSTAVIGTMHSIGWILPTKPVTLLAATFAKGQAAIVEIAQRLVAQREVARREQSYFCEAKGDLLDGSAFTRDDEKRLMGKGVLCRFFDARDLSTGEPLTRDVIVAECMNVVAAGADTTRTSMNAVLRYIYASPRALAKIREEIEEAAARDEFGDPPTYAQTAKLEYFQAAAKEAMRLHPAFGLPLQRVVPPGGRIIAGHNFQAGTLIGMVPHNIHRDERAFGKDASEFRPERWLDGGRQELERYLLSFGQGSRVCIGRNIAMLEMKVLAEIVRRYDVEILSKAQPYVVSEHVTPVQHGFNCIVKRRVN